MVDDAHPHCTESIFSLLNDHFRQNGISLNYQKHHGSRIDWLGYSQDFDALDFFWDVSDTVYQSNSKF
jgi:hypothetical protein